jgi:hypothetical protein
MSKSFVKMPINASHAELYFEGLASGRANDHRDPNAFPLTPASDARDYTVAGGIVK